MSPATGISSWYFSWTSGDPHRSGFSFTLLLLLLLHYYLLLRLGRAFTIIYEIISNYTRIVLLYYRLLPEVCYIIIIIICGNGGGGGSYFSFSEVQFTTCINLIVIIIHILLTAECSPTINWFGHCFSYTHVRIPKSLTK